jgi:hypothetical protein
VKNPNLTFVKDFVSSNQASIISNWLIKVGEASDTYK